MSGPVLCSYSKMLLQEHFDVHDFGDLRVGEEVVLDTRRGIEYGRVVAAPGATRMRRNEDSAGRVLRRANSEDRAKHSAEQVRVTKRPEVRRANEFARERGLGMTFIELEETLDERKLVLYFMAPQRVDFRDLVRELALEFNKKIELRQIGDRDVARLAGDVGSCGQELCCKTFLLDFVPVTMRMAKNQGLGLDNSKISGMCGRLKCCLKYEDELYTEMRKTMPISGQPVIRKADGVEGWVAGLNVVSQTIILNIKGSREEVPVTDVEFDPQMGERQVRRWQKEMREGMRVEAEQRRIDRENRGKNKGRAPSAPARQDQNDNAGNAGENSSNSSSDGEQTNTRQERPRRERRPRQDRAPRSESNDSNSSGGSDDGRGDDQSIPTDGSGEQKKKRRRRSRGGRGRRKPGGGEGGNSGGDSNSSGGEG